MNNITITNQYDADKLKELITEQIYIDSISIKNKTSIVLPDNINCGYFVTEKGTNIVLPENLHCQHMDISHSTVKVIPASLTVYNFIIAQFLNELSIEDNFITGGLDISHSNISVLPQNLFVNGYLNIVSTNINEIPEGTYIGKYTVFNANIKNIGEYYPKRSYNSIFIGGYIMQSNFSTPNIMRKIYNG